MFSQTPGKSPSSRSPPPQVPASPSIRMRGNSNSSDFFDEDYQMIAKKPMNQKKNKNQRYESDFYQFDQEQRNILHRAALEQSEKLIKDVLQEFVEVIKENYRKNYQFESEQDVPQEYIKNHLKTYIQKEDIFQCTALLICCFLNEQRGSNRSSTKRLNCLQILLEKGANVNTTNPNNLWSPIHWCAFYGDVQSCRLLLEKGAFAFQCDRDGMFPIDLAGNNEFQEIVSLLLEHLCTFLIECQQFWNDCLRGKSEDEFILFQELCVAHKRDLTNPILFSKLLYWSCYFPQNNRFIQNLLLHLPRIYVQVPLYTLKMMNSVHACALSKNIDALRQLVNFEVGRQYKKEKEKPQEFQQEMVTRKYKEFYELKDQQVDIFQMPRSELNKYKKNFHLEVQKFKSFEQHYFREITEYFVFRDKLHNEQTEEDPLKHLKRLNFKEEQFISQRLLNINVKDFYGNTALHVASLKSNTEMIKYLVKQHANPEIENKEFFKARQLTRNPEVIKFYTEYIKKMKHHTKEKNEMMGQILRLMQKLNVQSPHTSSNENNLIANVITKNNQVSIDEHNMTKEIRRQLRLFSAEIFVPDLVLQCNLKKQNLMDNFSSIFQSNSSKNIDQTILRLNFQISLLQNAGFEIYLMKSLIQEDIFYVMMRLSEETLAKQAEQMEIQVKLIDSYDLEPYNKENAQLFEPIRSRQRQIIVETHARNSINIDSLIKSETIESYYPMHTAGGIQIVKHYWQKLSHSFIPQPLNQIDDYMLEGKQQNFTSLTVLRLYFGEKISMYFAWISFQTCALTFIALPGLGLQLYILITDDFQFSYSLAWVFIVCVWGTVQAEFWKRKTSEINTRWGCVDLMLAEQSTTYKGPEREGFSGDDEISFVTGKLNKHQKKTRTYILFMLFIIMIIVFIGFSGLFVYGIETTRTFWGNTPIFSFILGSLQAVFIQVLNLLFSYFAQWSADQENHKYQLDYERSLIYKNVVFKLTNSYLPVIYFIVLRDDINLKDLFYFILPLIFAKKIYFIVIDILLPALYIKQLMNNYFKLIASKSTQTSKYLDPVEQFWSIQIKTKIASASRPVIKISQESVIRDTLKSGEQISLETKLDTDAVELNAQRSPFEGTINYYMEGMIDYGYATLFTAAFPGALFLVYIFNIIEIQLKIYKVLYINRREKGERCAGIGEWLNVMQFLGVFGVCSNFVTLYYKLPEETLKILDLDYLWENNSDWKLGIFLICILILILFNQFVSDFIPDKPDWVIMEIDKINFKAELEKQKETERLTKDITDKVQAKVRQQKDIIRQLHDNKKNYEQQSVQMDQQIENQKAQLAGMSTFSLQKKTIKKVEEITEYDMVVLGSLHNRFMLIDHLLTLKRIQQISNTSHLYQICQECSEKPCEIECIECDETFCAPCFQKYHNLIQQQHKIHLLVEAKNIDNEIELKVVKKSFLENLFTYSKEEKKSFLVSAPQKEWKKLEYFSFPVSEKSPNFKTLQEIYEQFFKFYMKDPGFEYRDFKIQLEKLVDLSDLSLINNPNFNVEDKLFLNRIAFTLFKQKRHNSQFAQFLKICQVFQEGLPEQKMIHLCDFLDKSGDGIVTKAELQNVFLQSQLQNFGNNIKVSDILNDLCPEESITNKEIATRLMNGISKRKYRQFLEGLLQNRN